MDKSSQMKTINPYYLQIFSNLNFEMLSITFILSNLVLTFTEANFNEIKYFFNSLSEIGFHPLEVKKNRIVALIIFLVPA